MLQTTSTVMKKLLAFIYITLVFPVLIAHITVAQQDSIKVEHEVSINSAGDTLIVIYPGYGDMEHRERHVHIDQEIIVSADKDTVIVTNGMREPRIRVRHRSQGGHSWDRLRHRRKNRGRNQRMEHEDARELRQMEMRARRLAQEVRQADEDSYDEKEALLRAQLEKIFDYKQAMKMKEIDKKRSELEEQSNVAQERQENRKVIIEDRVNQLLHRGSSYRW